MTSAAFITLVSLFGAGRAHAQSAEAEGLFNDGNKLMAEGKIAPACDAFEASNRVEPRAGTLIRLGECREQNHQLASAWSAYKDALTRVKDPRKREVAKAKAMGLDSRLSYLTVAVADASRVDGLILTRDGKPFDPMLWNRALPVDGGDYIIAGRAPGREDWETTVHVPVERARVSVEVPALEAQVKLTPPSAAPSAAPAATPVVTALSDPEAARAKGMFTTQRKIAIGVAGASVIAVAAGVVFGVSAQQKQDDAFKLCPDPATGCTAADKANALLDASRRRSFEANFAFGIAAAAAIGAGVLWLTGAPDAENRKRVAVVPSAAAGEAGMVVLGRF